MSSGGGSAATPAFPHERFLGAVLVRVTCKCRRGWGAAGMPVAPDGTVSAENDGLQGRRIRAALVLCLTRVCR